MGVENLIDAMDHLRQATGRAEIALLGFGVVVRRCRIDEHAVAQDACGAAEREHYLEQDLQCERELGLWPGDARHEEAEVEMVPVEVAVEVFGACGALD